MSTTPRCTTLIAEDEPLAREGLADWVRAMPQLELLATVADGASALQAIRTQRPQLVLMDIQMPGLTGLQVLRALAQDGPRPLPAVIFTTAYDEHALTAFELHAVDYLLKPFAHERFVEAVHHALQDTRLPPAQAAAPGEPALDAHGEESQDSAAQRAEADGDPQRDRALGALGALDAGASAPLTRVLVRDMGRIVPLHVDHIEMLRSDTKYTALVSKGRSHLVRVPLVAFEARLDPARFLKINRSCIVNLDYVEAMTPDDSSQFVVQMRDGTRVTASRDVSKQLRADSL